MRETTSDGFELMRLDTPTRDGIPHEGTMWRVETAVDRRHYACPRGPEGSATPALLPVIVDCIVDGVRYWECSACRRLWTQDRHWAEPDYLIEKTPDESAALRRERSGGAS